MLYIDISSVDDDDIVDEYIAVDYVDDYYRCLLMMILMILLVMMKMIQKIMMMKDVR